MCRYYPGYTIDKIRELTLFQFSMLQAEIGNLTQYEAEGKLPESPLEGPAGMMAARMMIPRG